MFRRLARTGFFAAVVMASACGGPALQGGPAPPAEPTFDLPTATSLGGPVLSSPRVQPIFFAGFPYPGEVDRFTASLSTSTYWTAVAGEYGVGALTALPGVTSAVTVPASMGVAEMQDALTQTLQAMTTATPPLPVRSDTIYALLFGPQTTLSVMGTSLCGPGHPSGFHDEWHFGDMRLPVAIIPACAMSDADSRLTGADVITPSLSHELLEAATDPYVRSAPAYLAVDDRHAMWALAVSGGELGDLCENEQPSLVVPADLGFPVQRTWSNAGARAGTGPCVPVPAGEIYFNGQADLPDQAQLAAVGGSITVPALSAAVGQPISADVWLRGTHNATTAVGVLAFEIAGPAHTLTAHRRPIMAMLGQQVSVPVDSAAAKPGVSPLLIIAGTGETFHLWVGAINRR